MRLTTHKKNEEWVFRLADDEIKRVSNNGKVYWAQKADISEGDFMWQIIKGDKEKEYEGAFQEWQKEDGFEISF